MQLPLSIQLQVSRYAVAVLVAIHGCVLFAIYASGLNPVVAVPLSLCVAVSFVVHLREQALRSAKTAIVAFVVRRDGELELRRRNAECIGAHVLLSTSLFYWLVALRLRDGERNRSLVLLPDMMDAQSWRRLAVVLRGLRRESQFK